MATLKWVVVHKDGVCDMYTLPPDRFGHDGLPSRREFIDIAGCRNHRDKISNFIGVLQNERNNHAEICDGGVFVVSNLSKPCNSAE